MLVQHLHQTGLADARRTGDGDQADILGGQEGLQGLELTLATHETGVGSLPVRERFPRRQTGVSVDRAI